MFRLLCLFLICSICYGNEVNYKIEKLLKPVVMVKLPLSSGSGVIVYSQENKGEQRTFILTNFHVIDGAIKIDKKKGTEKRNIVRIQITSFPEQGRDTITCETNAYIVTYNKTLDTALLELVDRSLALEPVTFLPKDEKLTLFQFVWHVGFPEQPAVFTKGQITALNENMWSRSFGTKALYLRTNSPIYFGNSGGGTFLELENEFFFIGMPTRIKNRDTPYVNWSISLHTIRKFFKEKRLEFIENRAAVPAHIKPILPLLPPLPVTESPIFEWILPR